MALSDVFSLENIRKQAKAAPKYMSKVIRGSDTDRNYLPSEGKKFVPGTGGIQAPIGSKLLKGTSYGPDSKVPMPPVRRKTTPTPTTRPTSTPTATPTPVPQRTRLTDADRQQLSVPLQYLNTVRNASKKYGVPFPFLASVLQHESMSWNPNVISGKIKSPKGALGVAQFMPDTASWIQGKNRYGKFDPFNPEEAIPAAAYYLSYLKDSLNAPDWYGAIAAYNAGPGNYRAYKGDLSGFPETKLYLEIVRDLVSSHAEPDLSQFDKFARAS